MEFEDYKFSILNQYFLYNLFCQYYENIPQNWIFIYIICTMKWIVALNMIFWYVNPSNNKKWID